MVVSCPVPEIHMKILFKVGFYLCNVIGSIFMLVGFVFGYICIYLFDGPMQKPPIANLVGLAALWGIGMFLGYLALSLMKK